MLRHVVFVLWACTSLSVLGAEPILPPLQSPTFVPGDLLQKRLQVVVDVMFHLNAGEKNTSMIPGVYTEDALFVDPLFPEGLKGHEALLRYHTALNKMIETFTVDVHAVKPFGNEVLIFWRAEATLGVTIDLWRRWEAMGFSFPALGLKVMKIGPVRYDGMSQFEFVEGEARISIHRDFYDSLPQYRSIPGLREMLGVVIEQNRKTFQHPSP